MTNFNSILTTIKNLSLTAKVGLGIGITTIVVGSVAGIVIIANNASKTSEISQNVVDDSNDDNSPSEPAKAELEENGGSKDDNKKTEQATNTTEPTTSVNDKSQTTAQKPNSNTPGSTNQSQSSNSSSASKPSTTTAPAAQPTSPSVRPSQSSQSGQPSTPVVQPTQPVQPSMPEKKPDYNLNDNYAIAFCGGVVSGQNVSFQVIDKSPDAATNSCVAKIYNEARKHSEYASMTDEELSSEVLSMGSAGPLDEDMCMRNGLICGRW